MALKTPSVDDLAKSAATCSLSLTSQDLASFRNLMSGSLASYARLDELTEPTLPMPSPRTSGFHPRAGPPGAGGA